MMCMWIRGTLLCTHLIWYSVIIKNKELCKLHALWYHISRSVVALYAKWNINQWMQEVKTWVNFEISFLTHEQHNLADKVCLVQCLHGKHMFLEHLSHFPGWQWVWVQSVCGCVKQVSFQQHSLHTCLATQHKQVSNHKIITKSIRNMLEQNFNFEYSFSNRGLKSKLIFMKHFKW